MSLELSPEDVQRIVTEVCLRLRDELVPKKKTIWMNVRQVRTELSFSSDDATRKWLRRGGIVGISRYPNGRRKIFARSDVAARVDGPTPAPRVHQTERWGVMAEPAVTTKSTVFMGRGLLDSTLPDGRPCLYYGGVVRIARADLPKEPREAFENFAEQAHTGFEALQSNSEIEPLEGAPMELSGCWDLDGLILMWRVPCVKIVTH